MREYFEAALTESPQNFTNLAKETDPVKATVAAATFAIGSGIFMSYWYGSLYVVIEGWRPIPRIHQSRGFRRVGANYSF
jgi:hypothetical protein